MPQAADSQNVLWENLSSLVLYCYAIYNQSPLIYFYLKKMLLILKSDSDTWDISPAYMSFHMSYQNIMS